MYVARWDEDSFSGTAEFYMAFSSLHALTDGTSAWVSPIGRKAEVKRAFWLRARNAQKQMRRQMKSPRFFPRAQVLAVERGRRAKVFAKMDDEATAVPSPSPANNTSTPSIALMGISRLGDLGSSYRLPPTPRSRSSTRSGTRAKRPGGSCSSRVLRRTRSPRCSSGIQLPSAGLVEEFGAVLRAGSLRLCFGGLGAGFGQVVILSSWR
ncbi:hypothetical protein C8F01DRAFT_1082573 [Mycena amicta]|nr:hypothetical protein C8F01DRAFT_1082573 [Mycena amicta]